MSTQNLLCVRPLVGSTLCDCPVTAVFCRHLLVNPRDRRVVIIESILCPSHFRETLSRVFFKHFEVTELTGGIGRASKHLKEKQGL